MILVNVNLVTVLVAAIVSFLFGWLWHSPMLFGKQWMKLTGRNPKEMNKKMDMSKMTRPMLMALVAAFVMAYVLDYILVGFQSTTISDALQGAFPVWLGFMATASLNPVLWEGKSWDLWLFNNAYQLVSLSIMAIVLISF